MSNAVKLSNSLRGKKHVSHEALFGESFRDLLWLVPLSILMLLPGLDTFGIIDPSDGLYAEGAREMLEIGNFLTPHVNYMPFYEKPILIYWLIIGAYKLFGIHEWAARLPSAISAIGLIVSTFVFLRVFVRKPSALMASLVLMSTPLFLVAGHLALIDIPLTFFLSITLFCFFRALSGGTALFAVAAYVSLALAVLLKGPVALVLAGLVVLSYVAVSEWSVSDRYRIWWQSIGLLRPMVGLIIMLVITLPWYVVETILTKGAFFQEFFVVQHLGRAAGTVNHQNPWFYYMPCFLAGLFPWSLYFIAFPKQWYRIWRKRELPTARMKVSVFCLCWAAVVFVFFSLLKAKLSTYILPAIPPLAILIGLSLDTLSRLKSGKYLFALGLVLAVCLTTLVCASPILITKVMPAQAQFVLLAIGFSVLCGGLALYLIAIRRHNLRKAIVVLTASTVAASALVVPVGIGLFYKARSEGFRRLLYTVKATGGSLALFMRDSPAASFYLRRKVPEISCRADLDTFKSQYPKPHLIMATRDVVNRIVPTLGQLDLVDKRGKWYLFAVD